MRQVNIESAKVAHWPSIFGLLSQCELPLEGAREHLDGFLVALDGDSVVGVIGMERYGSVALLRSLAVAPAWRRSGLASRLLEQFEGQARAAGVRQLYLLTTTAQAYFERKQYRSMPRSAAPAELASSMEFRGACPASAILMTRTLPDNADWQAAAP